MLEKREAYKTKIENDMRELCNTNFSLPETRIRADMYRKEPGLFDRIDNQNTYESNYRSHIYYKFEIKVSQIKAPQRIIKLYIKAIEEAGCKKDLFSQNSDDFAKKCHEWLSSQKKKNGEYANIADHWTGKKQLGKIDDELERQMQVLSIAVKYQSEGKDAFKQKASSAYNILSTDLYGELLIDIIFKKQVIFGQAVKYLEENCAILLQETIDKNTVPYTLIYKHYNWIYQAFNSLGLRSVMCEILSGYRNKGSILKQLIELYPYRSDLLEDFPRVSQQVFRIKSTDSKNPLIASFKKMPQRSKIRSMLYHIVINVDDTNMKRVIIDRLEELGVKCCANEKLLMIKTGCATYQKRVDRPNATKLNLEGYFEFPSGICEIIPSRLACIKPNSKLGPESLLLKIGTAYDLLFPATKNKNKEYDCTGELRVMTRVKYESDYLQLLNSSSVELKKN
ncbi:hypothetical protein GCM10007916_00490 [Psychromonas marina]|uniref:Uncharacterized protein n=1 Tax=Psychromonas marina TaxID=88364 RepID=A0ABQ6DV45_9GAMM|nr:hypothetical protein [Psychromonas marina]GLS88982.1 hypothetical protein GCM10007916_00490 [Psychromonas marina]